MKKSNLLSMLFLFVTSQALAQQPITLDLSQPTNPESFSLDANNVWAETFNDVGYPYIKFNDNAFSFMHLGAGDGSSYGGIYWDGFTYSKNGDNTDYGSGNWFDNQWGNMAGGGIKTDAEGNVLKDENGVVLTDLNVPYLLGYLGYGGYTYPPLSVFFDDVYQADGVYINTSPWPYYANIHGDGVARPLNQNGDYFKLFIHGLDENHHDNGQKVEYYLAKYENGTLTQSPNWEWIDLSGLGAVGGIYYTMESTDISYGYMNTAAYFCMDKLQVHVPGQTIPVTGVELNPSTLSIEKGNTYQLIANVLPENATNKSVTWKSSNTAIATVDESGLVPAIAKGTATITVTTKDGEFTANCAVTVTETPISVTSVSLNQHNINLEETETYQLIATVLPENATNKNVTWESSDTNIATVDENGWVTAIVKGTATITVTTEDGNLSDGCIVTVTGVGIQTTEKNIFKLYPTVTTGVVHVILPETSPVQIMDISGKVLQTGIIQSSDNIFDMTSYPSGIYLIKVGNQVVKVMKV
jgi:hypothetical protein